MTGSEIILPIPLLPQVHGLKSSTFRPPPLDGSLTVGEAYDFHWKNSPDHPALAYNQDDGSLIEVPWKHYIAAIHRAGHYANKTFRIENATPSTHTVAILALADHFTYAATANGLIRAECSTFVISPRNSASAIAHLLTATKTKYILVTRELIPLVEAALAIIETSGTEKPETAAMPVYEDLFNDEHFDFLPPVQRTKMQDIAYIVHSSGSTAFPKSIPWRHYDVLVSSRAQLFGVMDFAGLRLGALAVPMFHGLGMAAMCFMVFGGIILSSYKPTSPPAVPNPDSVYEGMVSTKSDLIFCVPIFIELWSRNPKRVEYLANEVKGVFYGGGPLNKSVGDELTARGVTIYQMFASSEAGSISTTLPAPPGKDWDYFEMSRHIKYELIPDGFGAYELILLAHKDHIPCLINTKINGVDAYATSDLIVPHPTKPRYFKAFGRADDQIMHNSGEKTNPGPLEIILTQDPHIQSAVVFGRGRFHAGVVVDPAPQFKFDPSDTEKLAEFRNLIWPSVEKANEFAPQHSRIFKEMILVASPSKPVAYTLKMTARRPQVISDYEPEIDALYDAVKETTTASTELPPSWSPEDAVSFIRSVVGNVMKRKVVDEDDLFQNGCDSLQATWIRNTILHALRESTKINTRAVTSMFVYQNPSISALARFVVGLTSSSDAEPEGNKVEEMLNLVARYGQEFSQHKGHTVPPEGHVVLITGSTGAIGSNVLAELLQCTQVSKVFALNRPGATTLVDRQREALTSRGYSADLLNSQKLVLAEADLVQPNLGLTENLVEQIRNTLTHIIHIGWRVDFNLSLQSFEMNIQGVRNLINLALSSPHVSPPRILFTSSIAVFQQYAGVTPIPEEPIEAGASVASGYGESKWVAEKILLLAGSETSLRPIVVRVGQVSGGLNGCWNSSEWIPSIVQSAALTKCLPALDQEISLIPLDLAARAIVELRDSTKEVLHLTHPKPVPWNLLFTHISRTLQVPLVPYSQWMSRLESAESEEALKESSALRLLNFYKSLNPTASATSQVAGLPNLATDAARKESPALEGAPGLDENDVMKWLDYWKANGVISF